MSNSRPRPPAKKRPARTSPAPKSHWLRNTILVVLAAGALGVVVFAVLIARTTVPTPNEVATSEATIVYYADGTTEIGRLGEATRRSVPLDEVPLEVQHAVLAAEDRSFYDHGGISPIGIGRAIWNNVTGGSTQGGSTITQQYAKNAFLSQERSWDRKVQEALLAFKLETVVSKDEILENYLNTIYFGRGAYGIEAAAIAYFGTPSSELTVEQGAVLASIIKSPSGLAPENDLPGLQGRWEYVLDSMVEQEWLKPGQRADARFPKIKKLKAKDRLGGQVGFMLTMVQEQLIDLGFDETEIQRGGLRITSTFDRQAQRAATAAVRKHGPSTGTEGLRIGLAAVRPGTGEIVAVYGGADFVDDQINNATRPFAQAGSTFKPFALAAATEQDVPLTSIWNGDSPATVNGYTFSNYGDRSYGPVSLLEATEFSINSAYVELESSIGVESVADAAVLAGIPEGTPGMDLDDLNLTFVLGTASPSGLDMANAYATFASRGTRAQTTVLKEVVGPNGGLLYQFQPSTAAAFDPGVADTVSYALSRVVTDGTGAAAQALGRPAAAKTGTTDDNKSAWFVGYTPQLAGAVLMAKEDADGTPISMAGTGGLETVTGGSFPAAIWTAFMSAALDGLPAEDFAEPPGGRVEPVDCPDSIATESEEVPEGCPTPTLIPEFEPDPTATLPIDPQSPPAIIPSQSPDPGLFPSESPSATPEPSPEPTPDPTAEPTEEARPE
ncbi:MAG: transglycosylase domain-containing protein [Actinomycetota bacterium]|nr:transglycosylase domain-containing protein [Actinomycetota bacterium]